MSVTEQNAIEFNRLLDEVSFLNAQVLYPRLVQEIEMLMQAGLIESEIIKRQSMHVVEPALSLLPDVVRHMFLIKEKSHE